MSAQRPSASPWHEARIGRIAPITPRIVSVMLEVAIERPSPGSMWT